MDVKGVGVVYFTSYALESEHWRQSLYEVSTISLGT